MTEGQILNTNFLITRKTSYNKKLMIKSLIILKYYLSLLTSKYLYIGNSFKIMSKMGVESPDIMEVSRIRVAMILFIVSSILTVVSLFGSFSYIFSLASSSVLNVPLIISVIISGLAVGGSIIYIISLIMMRRGFKRLREYGRDVGIGSAGSLVVLIGSIISIVSYILAIVIFVIFLTSASYSLNISTYYTLLSGLGASYIIYLISLLIVVIGQILLGIGFYKLGSVYNDSTTEIGGILIAIYILSFIGAILAVIGTGNILSKLRAGFVPQPKSYSYSQYPTQYPGYPPPNVPQVPMQPAVQNAIKSNGVAIVSVFTNYQVAAVSAQILGTNFSTTSISPNVLNPGTNVLTINFNTPLNLTVGITYVIRISLSNNTFIDVNAVYQV
ncbi:hypothetical protein ATY89_08835 [Sulfolobus acidocaldarius]|nr:hypothetical protein SacN8_09065 [Sulfolobus acidocaldarius N8]ALU30634.1 hypothetical protein ATY89_08835 [Sulfolobus acidocaldarius]ALU32718.1 hypothetical protein ATZ20_00245 [Sulfolobus acidocaldarius]WCM35659.1 DUF973 family protein [Sulfolobus acidocaldarius DSM 639]